MKKVTIAASALLVLTAQPAEASFLKRLLQEGAAQLKQAGRQKAEEAVQSAIGAIGQAASSGTRASKDGKPVAAPSAGDLNDGNVPGPGQTPQPDKPPSCCHL
jgi:hypothetical protein